MLSKKTNISFAKFLPRVNMAFLENIFLNPSIGFNLLKSGFKGSIVNMKPV